MESGVGKHELDALFVDQRPVLVRMLAKVVGHANLAEDLAQEAYLRVAQAMQGRQIEHLRAFLYQTAQHLAFDHLRKLVRGAAQLHADLARELLKVL